MDALAVITTAAIGTVNNRFVAHPILVNPKGIGHPTLPEAIEANLLHNDTKKSRHLAPPFSASSLTANRKGISDSLRRSGLRFLTLAARAASGWHASPPDAPSSRLCSPSTCSGQALREKIERTAPGGYGDTSANPQISDFPTLPEPDIRRGWPFRLRSLIA
ncbi:MAG TPA: hypothetical protein PKG84_00125 [Novosphingobium sp.]|nr:hypothetical protein [Novosphingobium sp.]